MAEGKSASHDEEHLNQGMKLENTKPHVTDLFIDDDDVIPLDEDPITDFVGAGETAELFVSDIEAVTGRLDPSEHDRWIRELTDMSVSGDFSLGRAAVDVEFRGAIDDHLGRGQTSSYREALALFMDTASRLLLNEDSCAKTWFDLHGAFGSYFELSKSIGSHSDECDKLAHRVIESLLKNSLTKTRPPAPDLVQLLRLREIFPNLEEPLNFIAEHLAVRRANGDDDFRIPPILLIGPPGIGKTYIAHEIARLIGFYPKTINMGSVTASFVLSGSDRKWGQSAPGAVFKTMLDSGDQMPIIVLDEVDKSTSERHYSPLGPLYHLLDPVMAPRFTDEFLGFEIDTSSITWIATANERSQIPEPLLDRFQCFDIPPPSKAQLQVIVQSMYRGMRGQIAYLPEEIPAAWMKHLEGASLREVGRELQRAIGRVALAKELDTGAEIDLDSATVRPAQRKRMGF